MNGSRTRIAFGTVLLAALVLISATTPMSGEQGTADVWEPIRFLVGDWEGNVAGQAGTGTARRSYAFILKDRYLHERNVTTYPPQTANKAGEVHEHWSFFSHDRNRKVLVLRQFHQEGFVNQYVLSRPESRARRLVFASEHFENFDNTWRARETYEIRSSDEFIETFELGAPGKDLEVYSRTVFKRAKRKP